MLGSHWPTIVKTNPIYIYFFQLVQAVPECLRRAQAGSGRLKHIEVESVWDTQALARLVELVLVHNSPDCLINRFVNMH